jgi:hypothetical protein
VSKRQRVRMTLRLFRRVSAVAQAIVGLYGAGAVVVHLAGMMVGR